MASIGRHKPPAHSPLVCPRTTVQLLPTVLPAMGVSTQRPDAGSHLRVPQSASVMQIGTQANSVSAWLVASQATSCRPWHLKRGAAGGFGPMLHDSKQL